MNNTPDPIFEALDRLARVADTHPFDDPMPGISRKARANRRRATALVATAVAAVVATGVGVVAAVELPGLARGPEIVGPAGTPTSTPETPETPETPTSPTPETSPDTPPSTAPSSSEELDLAEYERAEADVDGDGADDIIQVMVPADVLDTDGILQSEAVRLQIELATGDTAEIEPDGTLVPTLSGTQDLDGNGTAEVVLSFAASDVAHLRVLTWDGETVVETEPADDTPQVLLGGPVTDAFSGLNSALVEAGLISWLANEDLVPPYEVRLWTWQLDGTQLVATEAEQAHCMDPDLYRIPGEYPRPC